MHGDLTNVKNEMLAIKEAAAECKKLLQDKPMIKEIGEKCYKEDPPA